MKKLLSLLVLSLCMLANNYAQTPGFYKASTNTNTDQYPLGTGNAAKVQLLYKPADFNILPPSGNITTIYFRSVLAATTATYTNFQVSFLQNSIAAMPGTTYYTGLTAALAPTSVYSITTNATASTTNPGWFSIPLATPFAYNNAQSLIVEIQYTGSNGSISATTENDVIDRRIVSATATNTTGNLQQTWNDFGMDVLAIPGCIPAPTFPASAGAICSGTTTLNWPASIGATGYDVYLDPGTGTPTTLVSTNQSGTTFSTSVNAGSYVWKVIPKNATGTATGCTGWTFNVTASVTPAVSISMTPAGIICSGTPVTFTATPVNGGANPSYQWIKGTTNVGTNSASYTDNALINGDAISVVLTGNASCATSTTATSTPIISAVVSPPTAFITANGATTFCAGNSVTLETPTTTGFTYQWLDNGVPVAGATQATYQATTSGTYQVSVSNGACTILSSSIAVTVNPLPIATIISTGPTTFCEGSNTTLVASSGANYTYQWRSGGIDLPGETNQAYTATLGGAYSVATTDNGCTVISPAISVIRNPVPVVTLTPNGATTFCQGGTLQLCTTTSTINATYSWTFNNSTLSGATSTCYNSATATGNYCVKTTNPTTGCFTTTCQQVTVNVKPLATVTAVGSTALCQGNTVQLRAVTVNGYTYQWYRNNIAITTAGNLYFYSATTAGSYYVVITNGTCVTTTTPITVTVNPLPIATATAFGTTSFCDGGSVVLAANTGTGLTYQWKRATTTLTGQTAANYTATQTGLYQVTVSNGTCSASSPFINVIVSTMPLATIMPQGPTTFCQASTVVLEATYGAAYSYQWQKDGQNIPGATAYQYSANATGNYSVIITNGTCVATSAAQAIQVTAGPNTTITASGPLTFCQGGTVKLTAPAGSNFQYQWLLNGQPVSGATSSIFTAGNSGNYSLYINDGICDATSLPTVVSVVPFPVASITVANGNELSTSTFAGYQWYRNGVLIQGATNQTYSATQDGYYSVVVMDATGCSATSSIQRITSLDINQVASSYKVSVYPNPATTIVHIDAPQKVDISFSSIDGREIIRKESATNLDLTGYAAGVYLIKFIDHQSGALIKVERLVKGN